MPEIEERSHPRPQHLPPVVVDEEAEVDQRGRTDFPPQQYVVLRHVPGSRPQHQHRGRAQPRHGGAQLPRDEPVDVCPAADIVAPAGTVAVIKVHLNQSGNKSFQYISKPGTKYLDSN